MEVFYCDNCFAISGKDYCPVCGTKKIRAVNAEDFCLLLETDAQYCNEIITAFEDEDLPYSAMPYGSGIESKFGLPLSKYRLFVPFARYDRAKEIVNELENFRTEKLRSGILENSDRFHVLKATEKKIRKKLKISNNTGFFVWCENVVKTAYRIIDEGSITDCRQGGHYLFCYAKDVTLAVNSATYEIISATKN